MGELVRVAQVTALSALLGTALLGSIGCSDSDDGVSYAVTGRVIYPDGSPARSARIAIEYTLVEEPTGARTAGVAAPRPETCISFILSEEADVRLWITDYSNDAVRTVIDGTRPAGSYESCWDGTADDGTVVPDGLYYYHLKWDDYTGTRAFLLSNLCQGMTASDAYLVLTDSDGDYAVPWSLVPVGEEVPSLAPDGTVIQQRIVSPSVRICGWKNETSGSELTELRQGQTVTVDLMIQ